MNNYSIIMGSDLVKIILFFSAFGVLILLAKIIGLLSDKRDEKKFRKNEIEPWHYSELQEITAGAPGLKHWLAEELNKKNVFTGRDYELIRAHLEKELKALEAQKRQAEKNAVKEAIRLKN